MAKKHSKQVQQRAEKINEIRRFEAVKEQERHVFMKLGAKLRAYFFTGILVTAPVAMTFYVAYKVILWVDSGVSRLLPPQLKDYYQDLPFTVPGLGIVILLVVMTLVGMFAAGFVGKFFIRLGDWIVKKIPLISTVYSLLKKVFETFLSDSTSAFSKVVLLEYPRKGLWILGLVSTDTEGEVKETLQRNMVNVFVPTTPNPTSGFLIFVPAEDVVFLDMSVEDALKFIISGGIVAPDEVKKHKKQ
uniref:Membrane protein n=1 Tax=uncultured Alphaproteobacteria bacterium TaxID=91750 RepID=A0A6G8F3K7_9PROT|nr:membrane protein [uncultured Alphaproteobacteria bacterium]